MKLIEIPDTVMVLGPDDAGVMELSADLGASHIARELKRLCKKDIKLKMDTALSEVQQHKRKTPEKTPGGRSERRKVDLSDLTWRSKFD